MEVQEEKGKLIFSLSRDFNYLTASKIKKLVGDNNVIEIRLAKSKIVDSEALICLYEMVRSQKKIILHKPPSVMFEAMDILGLTCLIESGDITIVRR